MKEDYSDLPPTQRLKKLTIKIQEITQKIGQETAARDGLMKMKDVYEANSLLGDPMTVEGQLNESNHKLEKLKVELHKFQQFLEQASNAQQSPLSNRSVHNGQRNSRLVWLYFLQCKRLHLSLKTNETQTLKCVICK